MIVHDISHNISTDISYCIGCPVDPEPPEPSFDPSKLEYQALWIANGKTNNDTDKNVPNLVDASNPLVLSNFLYGLNSGYGKWPVEIISSLNDVSKPYGTIHFTKTGVYLTYLLKNVTNVKFKFRIRGLEPSDSTQLNIRILNNPDTIIRYSTDGEYEYEYNGEAGNLVAYNSISNETKTDFYVDIFPEDSSGLWLDGIDDAFTSANKLPVLNEYTVVGDIDIFKSGTTGVSKYSNWDWWGNNLYINSNTVSNSISNVIGFNSNGVIVTTDTSVIGNVGTDIPTEAVVNSRYNPEMVFRSLAIIPSILNEEQIRSVYQYIKTLKANNIG